MFKKLLFIIMVILASTTTLYAVPAAPHFHELQQPDGTTIQARQWGDEHSHGWENDTRHTIIFDHTIKGWTYAAHDNEGRLISSSILAKKSESPPVGIKKKQRPRQTSPLRTLGQSVAAAPSQAAPQRAVPAVGTKSLPVILIGFADVSFTKTKADFDNLLFGTSGNTMRNYYVENSYNQLTVNGGPTGVFGPVISSNSRTYYGANDASGNDLSPGTLVYEAVSKAAAGGFKFAPFVDQSKSCYVNVVVVAHQGTGEESGFDARDIWSHSWDLNSANYNGHSSNGEFVTNEPCSGGGFIKVNNYTVQPELAVPNGTMIGAGVFAHEFGHVLGLPDLYDSDTSSEGAGNWSLMAGGSWLGKTIAYNSYLYNTGDSPSHLDPWSKYYLGWISPENISGVNQNLPVAAASSASPNFYALGTGTPTSGEYFLVENRQKIGFDSYINGPGLLVWHIDGTTISNLFPNNEINNHECTSATPGACAGSAAHYGVALIQADNLLSLEKGDNRGSASDPFLSPKALTNSTAPNNRMWSGATNDWSVTSISASASTMSATFTGPAAAPVVFTNFATTIGATGAMLNGTVNDNNSLTAVTFEYGLTSGYGSTASGGTVSAGTGNTAVSFTVSGLACNSTYHYRVSAANTVSSSNGVDRTFTTTACPPGTPAVTSVAAGNSRSIVYFSPPGSDGGSPIISYTVTPSGGQPVSGDTVPFVITGLINGTAYTFTVKATNAAGTGPASEASLRVTPGVVIIDDFYETGYNLLQIAYDDNADGEKIMLSANIPVGGLAVNPLNTKGDVTIKGGYNDVFTDDDGLPSILGKVTLSAGKTSFQNVIVRAQ